MQDDVLEDNAGQRHGLELPGRARFRQPHDGRADPVPEPVGMHIAVGLERAHAVVLEGRVPDDRAAVLDEPGVALGVGQRPPVVGHVFLRPVTRADEPAVEGLAQGDDRREVLRPRRADCRGHTAVGASAASTASMSAGTAMVATVGTTASMVFRPSPVM